MKRDPDFFREILCELEASEDWLIVFSGDGDDRSNRYWYHIDLLCDAGFLTEIASGQYRMTYQGHEFIDAVRKEGVWEETKKHVKESSGSFSIEILKLVATALIKKKVKDHTGLEI